MTLTTEHGVAFSPLSQSRCPARRSVARLHHFGLRRHRLISLPAAISRWRRQSFSGEGARSEFGKLSALVRESGRLGSGFWCGQRDLAAQLVAIGATVAI